MENAQIQSLKRKVRLGDAGELQEAADELLAGGDFPSEVIDALKNRISAGAHLNSWTMGKLIIASKDRDLYRIPHTREMILGNFSVLIDLLRAGIPDGAIEERLCERLANEFERNAYGARTTILEALRDCGSTDCLNALEAIEYDFFGRSRTAKTLVDLVGDESATQSAEDALERGMRKVDAALGGLLRDAISSIRERGTTRGDMWGNRAYQARSKCDLAQDYIDLAGSHLERDLGAALNNIRKATESLLKWVIKRDKIQPDKKEPVDNMQLPTLIAILMDKKHTRNPEKYIHQHLESLQKLSTLGSHDQGKPIQEMVNREMVEGAIAQFGRVKEYFETDFVSD